MWSDVMLLNKDASGDSIHQAESLPVKDCTHNTQHDSASLMRLADIARGLRTRRNGMRQWIMQPSTLHVRMRRIYLKSDTCGSAILFRFLIYWMRFFTERRFHFKFIDYNNVVVSIRKILYNTEIKFWTTYPKGKVLMLLWTDFFCI